MKILTLHQEKSLTETENKLELHQKNFYSYDDFLKLLKTDLDEIRFNYFEGEYETYGEMIDGEFLLKFDESNYKNLSQKYIGNNPDEIKFNVDKEDGHPGKKSIKPGVVELYHVADSGVFINSSTDISKNRKNPVLVPKEILSSQETSEKYNKIGNIKKEITDIFLYSFYEYVGVKTDFNTYGVWFGFKENINKFLLDKKDNTENIDYIENIKKYRKSLEKIIDNGDNDVFYRKELANLVPMTSTLKFIVTGFDEQNNKINKNKTFKFGNRNELNVYGIKEYKIILKKFKFLLEKLEDTNETKENTEKNKNFGIIIETKKKPKILSNLDLKTPYKQVFFPSGINFDEITKVYTKKENIEKLKNLILKYYEKNNIEICDINILDEVNKNKKSVEDILTLDINSHKRWNSFFYKTEELNKDIESGEILPLIPFNKNNDNIVKGHIEEKSKEIEKIIKKSEINFNIGEKEIFEINKFLKYGNFSNKDLISLLNKITNGEYSKTVGVAEGYTLGEHTLMVLKQFDKIKVDYKKNPFLNKNMIKFMLLIHDIGKPKSVEVGYRSKEHEYTFIIAKEIFSKLNISKKKINLITSLLKLDIIGGYIQDNYNIEETLFRLKKVIKNSGIDGKNFLDLNILYFKSDTSSYTLNAEGGQKGLDHLFNFEDGKIEFSDLVNRKINLLYENI